MISVPATALHRPLGIATYRRGVDTWLGVEPEPVVKGTEGMTLYIAGSGHSGSTLLDMLLGGHPQVASLGEPIFLVFNSNEHKTMDRCTCGLHVLDCPFWRRAEAGARHLLSLNEEEPHVLRRLVVADPKMTLLRDDEGRFVPLPTGQAYPFRSRTHEALMVAGSARLRRWGARFVREVDLQRRVSINLNFLYDAVRVGLDVPVVVDSTKNPGYLKGVWLERTAPLHVVVLLRDGRAVCHSRMRREGVSMRSAARLWVTEHVKRLAVQATIPTANRTVVRYEQLCTDPERELRRLCALARIDWDPAMLDFRADRHNLGGNPMRFREDEREIRLDEVWRGALSPPDIREFDRIAGWLNRRLGYGRRFDQCRR